ncbi:hypothetical protein BJ741DRAFT_670915 [Chytriomyces cf. hyalinus JEL632]|nr:hypothetical protein BJ741DRAFT_671627 [Chytriomyces cf. hyalinus JEL632]KAI8827720.1 hypothetical protein BJ741DRAFT_670915 [Chytriomyces cf. hyalinus JEL632]
MASTSIQTPVLLATFLCAMAFENAMKGLILSVHKLYQSKTPVPAIMVVANTLSLVYAPVYLLLALLSYSRTGASGSSPTASIPKVYKRSPGATTNKTK